MTEQTTNPTPTSDAPAIAEVHNALYPASATTTEATPAAAEGTPGGESPSAADGAGGSGDAAPTTATVEPPVAKEGDTLLVKAGEDAPDAKVDETAPAVDPTSYTDFTLPETFTPSADLMTDFRKEAAALNLTQEGAQSLVNLYVKAQETMTQTILQEQTALQAQWLSEANALPELLGPTRRTTEIAMARVMDEYATPALREFLVSTGLANHPELVRFVARIGLANAEGAPTAPGGAVAQKTQRKGASALYPNSPN